MRRRDQIALGWSGDDVVASHMYSPVDAVALMIAPRWRNHMVRPWRHLWCAHAPTWF